MKFKNFDIDIILFNKILRRSILLMSDSLILLFSFLTSFFYTNYTATSNFDVNFFIYYLVILSISLPTYILSGQYISLTRYTGANDIYLILKRNTFIIINLLAVSFFYNPLKIDFQSLVSFWLITNTFSLLFRFSIRNIIFKLKRISKPKSKENIGIYGAGAKGYSILRDMRISGSKKVFVFFDDDKNLWNRKLDGVQITDSKNIDNFAGIIDSIYITFDIEKIKKRKSFFYKLKSKGFKVKHIPDHRDLSDKDINSSDFEPIKIEDLLGRESVAPDQSLLSKSIKGNSILVTGAGGSIGSELCNQIINLNPKKLVLLERNEFNLYQIDQKLKKFESKIEIIPILGCSKNLDFLKNIIRTHQIKIIFHSAAYKHVPIVESNPIEGISNNIISTIAVCKAAIYFNSKKVVLISSDKAVRPHNIMGVSKRLSEIIIKIYSIKSKTSKNITTFTMVRFGNVLGSSGSVVPLFMKQIANGGPLTVTHPEVIRYFMTTKEAAQLVLQASALSKNGDTFLLDMGEPIKIIDLARQLIELNGLQVKDENNLNGDIEIIISGLREGEKLYEELLVDGNSQSTKHKRIFKAIEKDIDLKFYEGRILELEKYLKSYDLKNVKNILKQMVPEWKENKNL